MERQHRVSADAKDRYLMGFLSPEMATTPSRFHNEALMLVRQEKITGYDIVSFSI
jgi:hypothetical protein